MDLFNVLIRYIHMVSSIPSRIPFMNGLYSLAFWSEDSMICGSLNSRIAFTLLPRPSGYRSLSSSRLIPLKYSTKQLEAMNMQT